MLVHRGTASDYQKWEAAGAEGWGPEEVLKYFKKAEVRLRLCCVSVHVVCMTLAAR